MKHHDDGVDDTHSTASNVAECCRSNKERSNPQFILPPSALAKHVFQVHGVEAAGKVGVLNPALAERFIGEVIGALEDHPSPAINRVGSGGRPGSSV